MIARALLVLVGGLSLAGCVAGAVPALVIGGAVGGPEARCQDPAVKCMSAKEAQEHERARTARDEPIIARARELTRQAVLASQEKHCAAVVALEQDVLALPPVELEGGVHDVIFLREPAILECLAADKRWREACFAAQGSATEVDVDCEELRRARASMQAATDMTRDACVARRERTYADATAASPSDRLALLSQLSRCPAASPAEQATERSWTWTLWAATSALRGDCAPTSAAMVELAAADRRHYDQTFAPQPDISRCIAYNEVERRRRADQHAQCLRDRGARQRQALAVRNIDARTRALQALPDCK